MPDAVAVIQFYLPYLLPRAGDWPAGVLDAHVDGTVVRLRVPAATEDLFPSDVDRHLGGMNLAWNKIDPPTRNITVPMTERCLDRIEAIATGPVAALTDVRTEAVQLKFFNAAAQ